MEEMKSISVVKNLIGTCSWQPIHRWIVFKLSGYCYNIFVKELGNEVYSHSCFVYNEQPNVKQANESSGYESSVGTWHKEVSAQNFTRLPEVEVSSKIQIKDKEDGGNSMALEVEHIHDCEVYSKRREKCEREQLSWINVLNGSKIQTLQDDRRTSKVI